MISCRGYSFFISVKIGRTLLSIVLLKCVGRLVRSFGLFLAMLNNNLISGLLELSRRVMMYRLFGSSSKNASH